MPLLDDAGFPDEPADKGPPQFEEPPTPLNEYQLGPFLEDWGPAALQEYAAASATSTQTPLSMNIAAVLATAAIPVQGKFRVQITADYFEPLNLYIAAVAPPAERKSAILRNMTHYLHEYESQRNELLAAAVLQSKAELDVLMQKQERAKKEAVKTGDMSELADIAQEIAEFDQKKPERYLCDDATPEALTSLMADNSGRIGMTSAEGGVFSNMGRYRDNGVPDIDVYLKAHAGDTIRVDRKSRPAEYIKDPCMTVLLMLQPVVIEGIMENPEFKGRGLTARFLYVMTDDSTSLVGRRKAVSPLIPYQVKNAYENALKRMLDYRPEETRLIQLSDQAEQYRQSLFDSIEPRLRDDLYSLSDWAGKLVGAVCRIAGVLHCYTVDDPVTVPISGETMMQAVQLGYCFLQHAQSAYGIMGGDKNTASAKYILKKLDGAKQITKRDLYRSCRGRFKKPDEMEPALELLKEHDYIKEILKRPEGGHRSSTIFYVNPKFKI